MRETKQQRSERLRQEVIKHDSYTVVARNEGLSRERVRQLAGNGLTTWSRGAKLGKCIDCRRKYKALMREGHDGRCERCRAFHDKYNQPYSLKAARQVRKHTHCKRGHELTPENTYFSHLRSGEVHRRCRTCQRTLVNARNRTPEGREKVKRNNIRAFQELRSDPERWQAFLTKRRKWSETSPRSTTNRYKNDPEFRARFLARQRERYRKQRANQPTTRKET